MKTIRQSRNPSVRTSIRIINHFHSTSLYVPRSLRCIRLYRCVF